ncbi:acetyltransferase, GNAT family [Synechococcus sp. PCC 7335]|uniref:GNAT family N-acetyltransferase n=1 Tax=Synechococcus sp. (strain ATCC 29403 / PCC 7335) TaxID=91464 RepID=UPI00017ECE31|nr:GNAT family N-acetyltransferase [Synechococcus sp. PCC 7335]EDX84025.1 acetyltransferase, GNAT family [Synechococcus sp. PCC 7335]
MKSPKRSFFKTAATIQKPLVKIATATDETPTVDVLVRAFRSDPVIRWVWPDLQSYLTYFPSFVEVFGGKAFAQKSAYFVEDYAGASLWLPPNTYPDEEALFNFLQCTVSKQRQTDLFTVFEQIDRYHPSEPHWYLPLIGIDPSQQSRGYGSALIRQALIQCDRTQTLAYLEASSQKSTAFYQRHGFELLGTIQVGTSPPLFPMQRQPQ